MNPIVSTGVPRGKWRWHIDDPSYQFGLLDLGHGLPAAHEFLPGKLVAGDQRLDARFDSSHGGVLQKSAEILPLCVQASKSLAESPGTPTITSLRK
jgi:hypothetical protein